MIQTLRNYQSTEKNLLSKSASILSVIGNTPLIKIDDPSISHDVAIYAKAEFMNPGGSVKDRAAMNIINDAIVSGDLDQSKCLLDASSGNTGIAYAMISAKLGFKVKICIPSNASKERIQLLVAFGADLELTDPLEGTDGAILRAQELANQNPDLYFYADQYNNPANWIAHYNGTAKEIFNQTDGGITHFVSGLGTSGTFVGTSKRLKEYNSNINCISFQPDSPFHGLEGLKHMETAIVPGIYDKDIADSNISVSTKQAYEETKWLARTQGLLVGISSGAALSAVRQVAQTVNEGIIVTVFPDRGDRYLSENVWRKTNE